MKVNNVILIGNTGGEIRIHEGDGKPFATFSIATTDTYKEPQIVQDRDTPAHRGRAFLPPLRGATAGRPDRDQAGSLRHRPEGRAGTLGQEGSKEGSRCGLNILTKRGSGFRSPANSGELLRASPSRPQGIPTYPTHGGNPRSEPPCSCYPPLGECQGCIRVCNRKLKKRR
jgi:hypothetical protein